MTPIETLQRIKETPDTQLFETALEVAHCPVCVSSIFTLDGVPERMRESERTYELLGHVVCNQGHRRRFSLLVPKTLDAVEDIGRGFAGWMPEMKK